MSHRPGRFAIWNKQVDHSAKLDLNMAADWGGIVIMGNKEECQIRELVPLSSKEEIRFFKLARFSISPNAITGFKETAIMQTAIITFNHLMEDYLAHAGYIDDLERDCVLKLWRGSNMVARIWLQR